MQPNKAQQPQPQPQSQQQLVPQSQPPNQPDESRSPSPSPNPNLRKGSTQVGKKQQDAKSVFVQSVDYGATVQELEAIFEDCGTIVRVTILKEKATNTPKGCAYVEFAEVDSVQNAIMLSGTKLRNRCIKVIPKRTNIRGITNPRGTSKQLIFSKFLNSLTSRNR